MIARMPCAPKIRMVLSLLAGVTVAALAGCTSVAAPVPLSTGADAIQIYRNADLPERCKELATIEVAHGKGCGGYGKLGNEQDAVRMFRNEVLVRGGNAGVIQSRIPPQTVPFCAQREFRIRGFAFRCSGS